MPAENQRPTVPDRVVSFSELYRFLEPGELLFGTNHSLFQEAWDVATADSFAPIGNRGLGIVLAAE